MATVIFHNFSEMTYLHSMQGRYCSSPVNFLIEMQEFLNIDLMHLVLDLVVQVLVNDHTASASEIVSVHLFLLLAFTAQG